MPAAIVGISLQPDTLEQLDTLAAEMGLSRSATVARLVELRRENTQPVEVLVDGRKYTPARARKKVHPR